MSDQRTALVLGGGGITGIAWEIGVLAGLAEAGVDLSGADLVVGTSAGSVVGAQLHQRGRRSRRCTRGSSSRPTAEKVARLEPGDASRSSRWAMLRTPRATTSSLPPPGRRARAGRGEGRASRRRSRSGSTSSASGWSAPQWPDRDLVGHRRRRRERRVPPLRPRLRGAAACRRSRPAAPSPGCTRRSPSTGGATSTAACARPPTPTWRRATTGSSCSPRSRAASGRWPASTRR